jgi:hypothetical protein
MNDQNNSQNQETFQASEELALADEDIISDINILTAIFGIPLQTQIIGQTRQREDVVEQYFKKQFKDGSGNPVVLQNIDFYIKLKSGEELFFTDDDSKNIILTSNLEPSRLIRNIISKIPHKMSERLLYLSKFTDESAANNKIRSLKDAVYTAYIQEWRLRHIFKRLLVIWRIYKMNKVSTQNLDPITFSAPEKEVHIYDWANKKRFVADAKSLANYIETKLMYNEYGFPVPMYPKNPFNNTELSYKQLISIYNQLKVHGELKWAFTTLREYNFNKQKWHLYHKSALTMNAIKHSILELDCYEARELFSDFIFAKIDELNIPASNSIIAAYQIAILKVPKHWYLEQFKALAISHYEAEHFNQIRKRAINNSCQKLFRKQNEFIRDLQAKRII